MSTHAQIHIAQTATDGAVRIEVMYDASSKVDMMTSPLHVADQLV